MAANEQLAVNHLPNRLHFILGARPVSGENKAWLPEKMPQSRDTAFGGAPERQVPLASGWLLKPPCRRRGREGMGFGRAAHPGPLPAAWEGHVGPSLPGPAGHVADVTGSQTPTPRVPGHAPAVTLDGGGLSPVPRSSGRGAS